jgi:hypothetical protein
MSSSITKFTCPECKGVLKFSDAVWGGSKVKCPHCHLPLTVPEQVEQPVMAGASAGSRQAPPPPRGPVKKLVGFFRRMLQI